MKKIIPVLSLLSLVAIESRGVEVSLSGTGWTCDGVSAKSTVRVNGREVGSHIGAFSAFTMEITEALGRSDNRLEVTADNRHDPSVPPNEGDSTMFGGIYRDVVLIEKPMKCIDPRYPVLAKTDADTGVVEGSRQVYVRDIEP